MKATSIDRVGERQKLLPRREPYWGPKIAANQHLGYRKIAKTTGSWIARLKKDGKRTYQKLGFETDAFGYDQASAAAVAWFRHLADIEEGTVAAVTVAAVDLTVQGACDEYITNLRHQKLRPTTAHDAQKRFERVVYKAPLAKVRLAALRKKDVQAWLDSLDLPPASLARTFTSLRAALNSAVRRERVGVAARQAWTALEVPKIPDNRRDLFLDLQQRKALLKAAKGGLKDLIQGAMLTGRRAGELTSATCKQFDPRTGLMIFDGKTGRHRGVPLSAAALKLFVRLAKDKGPEDFLFTRDDGLRWNHSDWDELVRDAATKAELPAGTCLYTMRHSFISQTISSGLSTLEVARLVGTSLQMIERHYGRMVPAETLKRLSRVKFV
jgi:integrase